MKEEKDKLFSIMDEGKVRTPRAEAARREKLLMKKLHELSEIRDEETFRETLEKDFGITPTDKRFKELIKIWNDLQR